MQQSLLAWLLWMRAKPACVRRTAKQSFCFVLVNRHKLRFTKSINMQHFHVEKYNCKYRSKCSASWNMFLRAVLHRTDAAVFKIHCRVVHKAYTTQIPTLQFDLPVCCGLLLLYTVHSEHAFICCIATTGFSALFYTSKSPTPFITHNFVQFVCLK